MRGRDLLGLFKMPGEMALVEISQLVGQIGQVYLRIQEEVSGVIDLHFMEVERQRQSRLFPEEMKGAADAEPGFSGHVVRRDLARKVLIDIILHFLILAKNLVKY